MYLFILHHFNGKLGWIDHYLANMCACDSWPKFEGDRNPCLKFSLY